MATAPARLRDRLQGHHGAAGDRAARARCARAAASTWWSRTRSPCRAVDGKPLEQLKEHFAGPTAVAYSPTDPVALAKVADRLRQGRAGHRVQGRTGRRARRSRPTQVKEIASLPSREELLAKLLFLHAVADQRFVRVLARVRAAARASVLDQVREEKGVSRAGARACADNRDNQDSGLERSERQGGRDGNRRPKSSSSRSTACPCSS